MMNSSPSRTRFFRSRIRPLRNEACLLLSLLVGPFTGPGLGAGHSPVWGSLAVDEPFLLDDLVSAVDGFTRLACQRSQLPAFVAANLPPLDDNGYSLVPGLLRKLVCHLAESLSGDRASLDPFAEAADRVLAHPGKWARSVCLGMQRYLWPGCEGSDMAMGQRGNIHYYPSLDNTPNSLVVV